MKKKNAIKKIGFTLLEMLIAVVIISTLVAISVPMYNKVVYRAEATEALSMLSDLSKAQNMYFMSYNTYADDLRKLDIQFGSDDEDNEEFISTARFTYYTGLIDEEQYCVYSESNNNSYTLAKNYKDNSEVICSGKGCNKVKAFVEEGSISEMCNGFYGDGICDRKCPAGVDLDYKSCSCKIKCDVTCGSGYYANENTCACECKETEESCKEHNKLWTLLDDCSCGCEEKLECEKGFFFNEKCYCEECKLTDEKCKNEVKHWVLHEDTCTCGCPAEPEKCNDDEYWDEKYCECTKKCQITNEFCRAQNSEWILEVHTDGYCSCRCEKQEECEKGKHWDTWKCSCVSNCDMEGSNCKEQNPFWVLNYDDNGYCNCNCPNIEEEEKICKEKGGDYSYEFCSCNDGRCKIKEEACKKQYEKWQLLNANSSECYCGCSNYQDQWKCEANKDIWHEDECYCEGDDGTCKLEESDCTKNGEGWALLNPDSSECKCGCNKGYYEYNGNCVKDECKIEDCTKYGDHWILWSSNSHNCYCGCDKGYYDEKGTCVIDECPLQESDCTKNGANWTLFEGDSHKCYCGCKKDIKCNYGYSFNEKTCECEKNCKLDESDCTSQNANYILFYPESKDCKCGCDKDSLKCDEGYYPDGSSCSCVENPCKLTAESCKEQNGNYILNNAYSDKCFCACGNSCGNGFILNNSTCKCEWNCDFTDSVCKSKYGEYYIAVNDESNKKCDCVCDTSTQCGDGYTFDKDKCDCVKKEEDKCELTSDFCKSMGDHWTLWNDNSSDCYCDCESGYVYDKTTKECVKK